MIFEKIFFSRERIILDSEDHTNNKKIIIDIELFFDYKKSYMRLYFVYKLVFIELILNNDKYN
jgi:hypothetical protein